MLTRLLASSTPVSLLVSDEFSTPSETGLILSKPVRNIPGFTPVLHPAERNIPVREVRFIRYPWFIGLFHSGISDKSQSPKEPRREGTTLRSTTLRIILSLLCTQGGMVGIVHPGYVPREAWWA